MLRTSESPIPELYKKQGGRMIAGFAGGQVFESRQALG